MKIEHFLGGKNKTVSSEVTWCISEHAQKTWPAKTKSFRLSPIRTRTHSSQSKINNLAQL